LTLLHQLVQFPRCRGAEDTSPGSLGMIEDGAEAPRTFVKTKEPGAVEIAHNTLFTTVRAAPESPPAGQALSRPPD
jgi:hypothetical protein